MRLGPVLPLYGQSEAFNETYFCFSGVYVTEEQLLAEYVDAKIVTELTELAGNFIIEKRFKEAFEDGLNHSIQVLRHTSLTSDIPIIKVNSSQRTKVA